MTVNSGNTKEKLLWHMYSQF